MYLQRRKFFVEAAIDICGSSLLQKRLHKRYKRSRQLRLYRIRATETPPYCRTAAILFITCVELAAVVASRPARIPVCSVKRRRPSTRTTANNFIPSSKVGISVENTNLFHYLQDQNLYFVESKRSLSTYDCTTRVKGCVVRIIADVENQLIVALSDPKSPSKTLASVKTSEICTILAPSSPVKSTDVMLFFVVTRFKSSWNRHQCPLHH